MFSKIRSFFASSVDGLVADIETRIDRLEFVARAKHVEQMAHQAIIDERNTLIALAQKEEARASTIAAKFRALISEF